MKLVKKEAERIISCLSSICTGSFSAGIGGSLAKGSGDEYADLDIYFFTESHRPLSDSLHLLKELDSSISTAVWEKDDGSEGGVDFCLDGRNVECWFRNSKKIDVELADIIKGNIRTDSVFWTPSGFHNYTLLSDLYNIIPIADQGGYLHKWKYMLEQYPEKTADRIISVNRDMIEFWKGNIHLESALKRGDSLYLKTIMLQGVHCIIQILFAVNRVYFPGDKKLMEKIEALKNKPDDTREILEKLIDEPADRQAFQKLHQLAEKIYQ